MFHMETNRLRQFCVIAETGSLTKAAKLLHITHSGLSKAMKLLQDELKCTLLQPAGRGLTLTDEGIRIYRNAKEFLAQEELLFNKTRSPAQSSLRIGTVEIFLSSLCQSLTTSPFSKHTIELLDLHPGQIEQRVACRELDYGITYAPHSMDSIDIIEVEKYHLGIYHLTGYFAGMNINELPFVVPSSTLSSNPLGIKERDGWIESITPRKQQYTVNLLSTGLELVLQGLCAIYIPQFIANNINRKLASDKKLASYPIPPSQRNLQHVYLLKHKDRPEDSEFKQLKKLIQAMIK